MQRYRIGRGPTNDIVVPEQTVSREHAELCNLGDGRFSIKDLGSTYGTAVLEGDQWMAVTEGEIKIETRLRLGEFETSVAELLDIADHTVVPGKVAATPPPRTAAPAARPAAPAAPAPPRPPSPARTAAPTEVAAAPPRPAPPRPPRTAAPTEVPAAAPAPARPTPPRPSPPRAPRSAEQTEVPGAAPQPPRPAQRPAPAPAAPRRPAFQFLRDMPQEKRVLVMLAGGFGVFLLISLIVLVLALALG